MFGRHLIAAWVVLVPLAAVLGPAPAADKAEKPKDLIRGKWVPADEGAVTYEFGKGGKVTVGAGGMCIPDRTGTYKFTGKNRVEMRLPINGRAVTVTLTVEVTRDALKTTATDGEKAAFKRAK